MAGSVAAALLLGGCGGNGIGAGDTALLQKRLLPQANTVSGTVTFTGKRSSYTVSKTSSGYTVTDSAGTSTSYTGAQAFKFSDLTVNLGIGEKSKSIAASDLKTLVELYVAFFNRVPDADGLAYWIDQLKAGQSIDQIAESFYSAAVLYSSLTGYSSSMSNSDFVRVIYKNVLGRSGSNAPPDADVQYWAGELAAGRSTKGGLIRTMLNSAHSFSGNATWGWVPQLLDNKVAVADHFAVQQGLNYNASEDSITKTMAMAAAVTSSDTTVAKAMTGFDDKAFNLTLPVISGVAAKGPLNNATVTAYSLKADGSKSAVLASGVTASDNSGKFSIPLPVVPTGAVQVEVTGGSYVSPYSGKTVTSSGAISTIVSSVAGSGTTEASVNPLTAMSASLAKTYMGQGNNASQSTQWADQVVQWQYGLQASPAVTVPKFEASAVTADPKGAQLGLVLTAIDTMGNKLAPSDPDAISTALAADYADGVLDGKAGSTPVKLAGNALSASTLQTEFLKSVALSHSALGAGLRPGYVDAQYSAGTLAKKYESQVVPVYVAKEVAAYYTPTLSTQIPNTVSFDASATGYSCKSGAALTFDASGNAQCNGGSSYSCTNGATLITSATGQRSCSDGAIPLYTGKEIPAYTAPAVKPYSATSVGAVSADRIVGAPATGTLPVYTATTLHVFTEAERAAMMANDQAAGDLAASKVSGMQLNQAQVDAYKMMNDLIMVAYGPFVFR
ncbi:hypothetical protein AYR66_13845 [Noviherbaspirillum denitrificans]|uniref:DUF4214 domain-containing protein n=1 Tax=Noviherbaspirillum denitrificans TaxID=1968433 RepID=A0A254TE28_9BURK|nr:hypothetical protein AYR66_13845 [Noviherbaspirillum denitrificans]